MPHYLPVEASLQGVLEASIPLLPATIRRIRTLCVALMLAGEVPLSRLARQLPHQTQQASRKRWIKRTLSADYLTQEYTYKPFISHQLAHLSLARWHLVMDRTTMNGRKQDVVTISLHYHGRAIPLVWEFVPFGGGKVETHCALIRRCAQLIPSSAEVVFHGDSEFGALDIVCLLCDLKWEFMVAQKRSNHFWAHHERQSQAFETLAVPKRGSLMLAKVGLGQDGFGCFNLLAFKQPRYSGGHVRREITYILTSLPLTRGLKRIGRRRWGTEPFYRDYKSAGWRMTLSQLAQPQLAGLFVIMALTYVWMVAFGRRITKLGLRKRIDSKPQRSLSYFRIGWDWLVHAFRNQLSIHANLRLYP